MPDNEVDIIAEFGTAIERFQTAWKAYADAISPERMEREIELDRHVQEKLSYYNDPVNPRHPKVIRVANEIGADMLLLDHSWQVTGPGRVIAARKAVDERLQAMTAELALVLETLRPLPPPTVETLTDITEEDLSAWAAVRTNAKEKVDLAGTQGVVLAHAFAALLEASVHAIDLRTNASSTMTATRRYGLTRSSRPPSSL